MLSASVTHLFAIVIAATIVAVLTSIKVEITDVLFCFSVSATTGKCLGTYNLANSQGCHLLHSVIDVTSPDEKEVGLN